MTYILGFIAFIFILFFLVMFIGPAVLIGVVIKKSTEKKSPEFLINEKVEMQQKVAEMVTKLEHQGDIQLSDITNDLDYSYKRWITSILTGYMNAPSGEKVLAFQRRQRGNDIDVKILAQTKSKSFYFDMNPLETIIDINGKRLGSITRAADIVNAGGQTIGTMLRLGMPEEYSIDFKSGNSATIRGSFDNKMFVNNIHFERANHPIPIRRMRKVFREPYTPYAIIKDHSALTAEEAEWVMTAAILESLVYSFSFTS